MNFQINDTLSVTCERKNTRSGFKHTAKLYSNGHFIKEVKVCYQNRTWERFRFDSVLQILGEKAKRPEIGEFVKNRTSDSDTDFLKNVSTIASLGSLLFTDEKDQNKFKANILKAGINADFPDDFESLPEVTKSERLNGAIEILKG
jgi:prenyltransferase beta subunit